MALDVRRQQKFFSIPDENMKAVDSIKLNQTKAPNEMKRAILGDIAGNRIHSSVVGLSNQATHMYKSRLPVLKAGVRTKPVINKPKIPIAKENQLPPVGTEKQLNVKSIIEKTDSLKLEPRKKTGRPVGVDDIDRDDKNPFTLAVYAKDIYKYLRHLEQTHPVKEDYLKDREITPKMRSVLIDWLVDVQAEFKLLQETLHITVGVLDLFLQNTPNINRQHMQLIGATALFLAAKYEEITVPSAEELVFISASAFTESALYAMEREMFKTINFDLSRPISLNFLRRYSKAGNVLPVQHTYAKYFLELALLEYSLCHVNPSLIAASALYMAFFVTGNRETIDSTLWTPNLEYYSGYKFVELKPILKSLAKIIQNAKVSKLQAVFQKYSHSKTMKVSCQSCLYSSRMKSLANSE